MTVDTEGQERDRGIKYMIIFPTGGGEDTILKIMVYVYASLQSLGWGKRMA